MLSFPDGTADSLTAGDDMEVNLLMVKVSIRCLTQSCDPVSCYREPVERTNEISLISFVRSAGFP